MRNRVEPAASPAVSATAPKAEILKSNGAFALQATSGIANAAICGNHSQCKDPGYRFAHPGYAR